MRKLSYHARPRIRKNPRLFTAHDPTRLLDQEVLETSRVGSGPVGSDGSLNLTGRVGSGHPHPNRPDPTRPDSRGLTRSVNSPGMFGNASDDVLCRDKIVPPERWRSAGILTLSTGCVSTVDSMNDPLCRASVCSRLSHASTAGG